MANSLSQMNAEFVILLKWNIFWLRKSLPNWI